MPSSFFDEMLKIAEEQRAEHPALPYVKGIGGMAVGSGLGYLAAEGANRYLFKGEMGKPGVVRVVAPIAGGVAGLAASGLQQHMLNKARENIAAQEEPSDGGEGS